MVLAQSKYHFIGIGGIGMCGLAELLFRMGAQVTGSDPADNAQTRHLSELGISIYRVHGPENLGEADVVVYSSAIKPDHVERVEARRRRIPLIPRAEALAELMRLKRGIAIAGTHGKTTTTSLTASAFLAAGSDPTAVVGGRLQQVGSTAVLGGGAWLIAEADESDGSFSKLSPEIVVITNIDNDHLDHYGSFDKLKQAFLDFASQVPFYGLVLACGDDSICREVFAEFSKKIKFYGFGEENDYRIQKNENGYEIFADGEENLGAFKIPMPGRHNALNALAALAVAREAGIDWKGAVSGVEGFAGVDRRSQHKGMAGGIDVYDDYGHHPTEVRAVLSGFRERFPKKRLVVVFQPHRYSRTKLCWNEFLGCFGGADQLLVLDIYAAGEAPDSSVSGMRLAAEIENKNCEYVPRERCVGRLRSLLQPGDVLLTLGAGDGWKIGRDFLDGDGN